MFYNLSQLNFSSLVRNILRYISILFLQLHHYFKWSIIIVSIAFLIYSLLSPSLIIFLLNINSTFSPFIFK